MSHTNYSNNEDLFSDFYQPTEKYDDQGNLIWKKGPDPNYEKWYKHDERGNVSYSKDSEGIESWFDDGQRLIHRKLPTQDYEVWFDYYESGRVKYQREVYGSNDIEIWFNEKTEIIKRIENGQVQLAKRTNLIRRSVLPIPIHPRKKADFDQATTQTSDVPDEVKARIKEIQKSIPKEDLYSGEDEKGWLKDGKQILQHLTVLYGIEDDDIPEIKELFQKQDKITIKTDKIHYFDKDDYTVVVLRCQSDDIRDLHGKLKRKLDVEEDYATYKPHITIAYLQPGKRLENEEFPNVKWEINSIEVVKSNGDLEKIKKGAIQLTLRKTADEDMFGEFYQPVTVETLLANEPLKASVILVMIDYPDSTATEIQEMWNDPHETSDPDKIELNLILQAAPLSEIEKFLYICRKLAATIMLERLSSTNQKNLSLKKTAMIPTEHEQLWQHAPSTYRYDGIQGNPLGEPLIQITCNTCGSTILATAESLQPFIDRIEFPPEIFNAIQSQANNEDMFSDFYKPKKPDRETKHDEAGNIIYARDNVTGVEWWYYSNGQLKGYRTSSGTGAWYDEEGIAIPRQYDEEGNRITPPGIQASIIEEDMFKEFYPPNKRYDEAGNQIYARDDATGNEWWWHSNGKLKGFKLPLSNLEAWYDEDGQIIKQTRASILDDIRTTLDPVIWDLTEELPKLRPEVKDEIINRFFKYIAMYGGYQEPEAWIDGFYYTGSTATKRYVSSSDIDIHILVNWSKLAQYNPDKRGDPREMWRKLHDIFWWTLNKETLPDTKHPLTYYVIPPGEEERHLETTEEAYDMQFDKWIVAPRENPAPPSVEMDRVRTEADEIMDRIDLEIAKTKKGLVDYVYFKDVLNDYGGDGAEIKNQIQNKLVEIEEALMSLKDEYDLLKNKRKDGFLNEEPIVEGLSQNWTPSNILFKLVERYKYMDVLRNVSQVLKNKETSLTDREIPAVVDALSTKKLNLRKTAQEELRTWGLTSELTTAMEYSIMKTFVDAFNMSGLKTSTDTSMENKSIDDQIKIFHLAKDAFETAFKNFVPSDAKPTVTDLVHLRFMGDRLNRTADFSGYPQIWVDFFERLYPKEEWGEAEFEDAPYDVPQELPPGVIANKLNLKKLSQEEDMFSEFYQYRKYDSQGNLIYEKDPETENEYWWEYDNKGNKISERNFTGFEERYNKKGNKIYTKYPEGNEIWYEYNEDGNLIHLKSSDGNEIWFNNKGKMIKEIKVKASKKLNLKKQSQFEAIDYAKSYLSTADQQILNYKTMNWSAAQIAQELINQNIPASRGGHWNQNMINVRWNTVIKPLLDEISYAPQKRTRRKRADGESMFSEFYPEIPIDDKTLRSFVAHAIIDQYMIGDVKGMYESYGEDMTYEQIQSLLNANWETIANIGYDLAPYIAVHPELDNLKRAKKLRLMKQAQEEEDMFAEFYKPEPIVEGDQTTNNEVINEILEGYMAGGFEYYQEGDHTITLEDWVDNILIADYMFEVYIDDEYIKTEVLRRIETGQLTTDASKKQADVYNDPNVLIAVFEARNSGIYDYIGTRDYVMQKLSIELTPNMWKMLKKQYLAINMSINKRLGYEGQPKFPYDNKSILLREPGPPEGGQDSGGLGAPLSEETGAANDDQWTGDDYDGLSNKPSTPGWKRKPEREKYLPEFNETHGWPGGQVRQVSRDNMIKLAKQQIDELLLM